jgi:hypothetical protein
MVGGFAFSIPLNIRWNELFFLVLGLFYFLIFFKAITPVFESKPSLYPSICIQRFVFSAFHVGLHGQLLELSLWNFLFL